MSLCIDKCRIFNYYNSMLCIVLAKLQVGMPTHSSSLNFCRRKEKKDQQNMKCHNANGTWVQMEFQFWIIRRKRESHEVRGWNAHMDHETSPLPERKCQS